MVNCKLSEIPSEKITLILCIICSQSLLLHLEVNINEMQFNQSFERWSGNSVYSSGYIMSWEFMLSRTLHRAHPLF